jgi:hypothetical protein
MTIGIRIGMVGRRDKGDIMGDLIGPSELAADGVNCVEMERESQKDCCVGRRRRKRPIRVLIQLF